MKLKVYAKVPAERHIEQIVEVLEKDGVVIIPTDGVYSFACLANRPAALERLAKLKGIKVEEANFSFLFADFSKISDYAKQISNESFKLMKRLLPGPFTFILNAHDSVKRIIPGKKTIGIRMPDHAIPQQVVKITGFPLLTTSVYDTDETLEYTTDPDVIAYRWEDEVDLIVDGGFGYNEPSTIIDCTDNEIVLIRKGIGEVEEELIEE